MSVCLDAFALLAWLQDEPGAEEVESYLGRAAEDSDFRCYLSTTKAHRQPVVSIR